MPLTKLVGAVAPFHSTVELAVNPDPFTVRVNVAPPDVAVDGLRLLIAGGTPAVIVKAEPLDIAAPVLTVTVATPCVAIRVSAMAAVSVLAFMNVVGIDMPFHKTVEFAANPDPFTVNVNETPPACAAVGLRLLIATGPGAVIVKTEPLVTIPLTFTVTVAVPCEAMRLPGIDAVS